MRRPNTVKIIVLCVVGGGVAMVALVTGIGSYDLPSQSRKLEAVMAESKRLGLPMTAPRSCPHTELTSY